MALLTPDAYQALVDTWSRGVLDRETFGALHTADPATHPNSEPVPMTDAEYVEYLVQADDDVRECLRSAGRYRRQPLTWQMMGTDGLVADKVTFEVPPARVERYVSRRLFTLPIRHRTRVLPLRYAAVWSAEHGGELLESVPIDPVTLRKPGLVIMRPTWRLPTP